MSLGAYPVVSLSAAHKDRLWSANYAGKVIRHLELHVFPWIGRFPMGSIAPTELVRCLHRIKERGHLETAQRVREAVQHVFQYAVDLGALEPSKNFVNSRTPAHLVPLPTQAVTILRDLQPLTGPAGPIFRSMAKRSEATRYMSDNTINSALRTLGYDTKEQITGHGFRATARTLIRELLGWDREVTASRRLKACCTGGFWQTPSFGRPR